MNNSNQILRSWKLNSSEWINLLNNEGIESRKITNSAIIERISLQELNKVLDLGCGEGWLTRALSRSGFSVTGIDATGALIEDAKNKGTQDYHQLSYEDIASGKEIPGKPYDGMVFNFSLYEKVLTPLLQNLKMGLRANGLIFIQTIHPYFLIENKLEYKGQWIENSWNGLKGNFRQPHPWYARTLSDWLELFNITGYELIDITEPLNEKAFPVSVIFTITKK